ncbi:MAG TPA: fused MFS/spermidine synthase, partial [Chthonomonadaceae bacterium]|nr:fused MFS/spermidine synthase [Chthonomonadaceae bacterium]
ATPAQTEIRLGDARLTLEQEPPQNYDVLVVDAFSSDAIPIHLLTREAMALYFRHLKPSGVLAVHISNRYLDLLPVVVGEARALGKEAKIVFTQETEDSPNDGRAATQWVLVTARNTLFDDPLLQDRALSTDDTRQVRLWTDDYSNLLQILR